MYTVEKQWDAKVVIIQLICDGLLKKYYLVAMPAFLCDSKWLAHWLWKCI